MYNEAFKKQYIEEKIRETTLPKGSLELLFGYTEQYENELEKDVCCFMENEILNMLKGFNSIDYSVIANKKTQLSLYTTYCIKNNMVIDGQNHFENLTADQLDLCINKMAASQKIITRDDLFDIKNNLRNISEWFILLGLFEGICSDGSYAELLDLSIEDIDQEKMIAHTSKGRSVPISIGFLSAARECNETYEHYTEKRTFPLNESGKIIKNYRVELSSDPRVKSRRLYRALRRSIDMTFSNVNINGKDIINGGKLEYIQERCKELKITPHDFLYNIEYREELEERYDQKINVTIFWRKYGEYLESTFGK